MSSYRPKIKSDANGTLTDLGLDAETVKGVDVVTQLTTLSNSIPTETTVENWGFIKNGITTVNSTAPDANGNVNVTTAILEKGYKPTNANLLVENGVYTTDTNRWDTTNDPCPADYAYGEFISLKNSSQQTQLYITDGAGGVYIRNNWNTSSTSGTAGTWRRMINDNGGKFKGPISFQDGTALPNKTSMQYICGIDAFANGGEMGWISKTDFLSDCAKTASPNNLLHSGNEFTFASSGFSGDIYFNYRTVGGTNGNITNYIFGNGGGGALGTAIHTGNINTYALANAGSSPNLNDGSTVTQPGGANALSIKTSGSTKDTGILRISDDNAYLCNSSDDGYSFAVWDTDLTTDFSGNNVDAASFVVLGGGTGAKIRGNNVVTSNQLGTQVTYSYSNGVLTITTK